MSDGGLHLPYTPDDPYHLGTPLTSAACRAVAFGDAEDGRLTEPRKISMKLHVNWGHASAQQLRRELVDSGEGNANFPTCVDGELAQCEFCRASVKAQHIPAAGTSTVAIVKEKLQADLLFLDDIIAPHVMDVSSGNSLLIPVQTGNSQEVWGALRSFRFGVLAPL